MLTIGQVFAAWAVSYSIARYIYYIYMAGQYLKLPLDFKPFSIHQRTCIVQTQTKISS